MSKKDVFDKAIYTAGLAANTKQLEEGVKNNDTAVIIDAVSSIAAAIPGPRQLGRALASFGLSGLPIGDRYSKTGEIKPSDVVSMVLGGAGLVAAGLTAAGITVVAGIPVGIAATVIATASVINSFAPSIVDEYIPNVIDAVGDIFIDIASGQMLENVIDSFGDWFLDAVVPSLLSTGQSAKSEESPYLDYLEDVFTDIASGKALEDVINGFGGWFLDNVVPSLINAGKGINEKTNTDFQSAQNFVQRIDPLALDLDGDGIETVSANAGITFDFNGDGIKTGTGWLSGDDGFLVLDRNDNGTIDNGSELFGIDTVKSDGTLATDGFDALRDLDSNGDGIFDAQDELFDKVRVWQDKNQDGISQADELKTLKEHGISAINLDSTASSTIDNGNLISSIGTMKLEDGSSGTGGNLDLASNPFYREYTDKLPISDAIAALPEMRGSGAVRDLREAASQSAELAKLLTQYSELSSREEQRAMLRPIISAWANSAERPHLLQRFQAVAGDDIEVEIRPSSNPIDNLEQIQLLTKIGILEVFNASDFYNITRNTDGTFTLQAGANVSAPLSTTKTPEGKEKLVITLNDLPVNAVQIDLLNQAYDSLSNSVYQGLLQQTRLMPYLQAIGLNMEEDGINLDYSGIYQKMAQTHAINPVEAIVTSIELQELLEDVNLSAGLESRRSAWISGLNEQDSNRLHAQLSDGGFNALTMGHLTVGTAGNDSLTGNQTASNQLYGGAGDDVLRAPVNSKDNLLAGGTGNDTLHGSHNSDTYIFNAGDGQDTIIESGSNTDAVDVLRFGEGITAQDLWFEQTLQDLKISVHGSADSVTVKDWYKDSDHRIEQIHLSNGDRLLESQVQSLVDAMASFSAQSGAESAFTPTQREQLDTVIAANWQ